MTKSMREIRRAVQDTFAEYGRKFDKPAPMWVSLDRVPEEAEKVVRSAIESNTPLEGEVSGVVETPPPSKKGSFVCSSTPLAPPDHPVYKRGYVIGGKILRPSREPKPDAPSPESGEPPETTE
jgi:hypothetical protein